VVPPARAFLVALGAKLVSPGQTGKPNPEFCLIPCVPGQDKPRIWMARWTCAGGRARRPGSIPRAEQQGRLGRSRPSVRGSVTSISPGAVLQVSGPAAVRSVVARSLPSSRLHRRNRSAPSHPLVRGGLPRSPRVAC
jgi:hypothetical protein